MNIVLGTEGTKSRSCALRVSELDQNDEVGQHNPANLFKTRSCQVIRMPMYRKKTLKGRKQDSFSFSFGFRSLQLSRCLCQDQSIRLRI
jgi:hypothetical protein